MASGCSAVADISGETAVFESAPYFTEELSYMLYASAGDSYIEITGVQNEHQTEYTIPRSIDGVSVTSIGKEAFMYAPVVGLTLPDTLTSIKNGAFYNCAALTSVRIPDAVAFIDDYAFYYCSLLSEVIIPPRCADIGGLAFFGTPWFESLDKEFEILGDGILLDYNGTEEKVIIPSGVKNLSSAFYRNTVIKSVILPDTTTKIGNAAFGGCTSLTSVEIPGGVTHIGDSAFYKCTALETLTIPASVSHIGVNAFEGCPLLILICSPGSYAAEYAEASGIVYGNG